MNKLFLAVLLLSACNTVQVQPEAIEVPAPEPVPEPQVYLADWPEKAWSELLVKHLMDSGKEMLSVNPADAEEYCPGFPFLLNPQREQFYVMLVSALARYESGFKPGTSYKESFNDGKGQPVISRGLLQISIESGNGYGCGLKKAEELHDPETNLRCGVKIMNRWLVRDGRIASSSSPWKGMARYWSPFRKEERKKAIRGKVRALPFCH